MRVAVVTAGGDSPGMNACIRAVVRAAGAKSYDVWGVRDGALGWARGSTPDEDLRPLRGRDVSNLLDLRGTILGTARESHVRQYLESAEPSVSEMDDATLLHPDAGGAILGEMMAATLRSNGIDAIVIIGGDKSSRLSQLVYDRTRGEIPMVVIPASIDNDVFGTEITLGFDSAVSRAVDYVDDLRETARAMNRIFVIEVMGRNQGHIAAEVGLAAGAEEVLVPELPLTSERAASMVSRLSKSRVSGRGSALVIVAEGVRVDEYPGLGAGDAVGAFLGDQFASVGWDVRTHIIGHVQRGARPTARTRNLAARSGVFAVDRISHLLETKESAGYPEMCCIDRAENLRIGPVRGDMVNQSSEVVLETIAMCRRLSYLETS